MAPINRVKDKDSHLLHELTSIRNTLQLVQRLLNKIERELHQARTPAVERTSSTGKENQDMVHQPVTRRRELINKIYNTEVVQESPRIESAHAASASSTAVPKTIKKPTASKTSPNDVQPASPEKNSMDWAFLIDQELENILDEDMVGLTAAERALFLSNELKEELSNLSD